MPRKLMKFLILFDNTNLLFFPGQFLSGRVLLELQEDTPALGEKNDSPIRNTMSRTNIVNKTVADDCVFRLCNR